MGRWTASVVVLACVAFACGEAGTIVAEDGGASDAGEAHDTVFVPQLDGDGGDAPMEWDGSPELDGGEAGGGETGTLARLGEPTFVPASGMTITQSSTIALAPPAAFPANGFIFYTLDGSAPTHQSLAYAGPVQITVMLDGGCGPGSATVEAMASAPGFTDSFVAIATYPVSLPQSGSFPQVDFSPASEVANNDLMLTLTGAAGTTVCYTLDGTTPTCSPADVCAGSSLSYSGPISIGGADPEPVPGVVTVTAVECFAPSTPPFCASTSGGAVQQNYDLAAGDPTMSNPSPGLTPWSPGGVTPTLATATVTSDEPVSIHMTTDGTTPTCTSGSGTVVPGSSTLGPFTSSTTVNAVACKTGYLPSEVVPFVYSVQLAPPFLSSQSTAGAGLPGWSWAGAGNPVTSMVIPSGATTPYGPLVVQQVATVPCSGTAGAPEPSSCTGTAPPPADFICWSKTGAATCSCASPIALTPAAPSATLPAAADVSPGDTLSVIACQSSPPVNATSVFASSPPTTVSF